MGAERRAGSHVLCPGRCTLPWHAAPGIPERAGAERARAGKLRAGNELHPPQDSWDGAERSCPSQKQRAAELLSGFWDEKKRRTRSWGWLGSSQAGSSPKVLLVGFPSPWGISKGRAPSPGGFRRRLNILPCSGCVWGSLWILSPEVWVLLLAAGLASAAMVQDPYPGKASCGTGVRQVCHPCVSSLRKKLSLCKSV